MRQRVSERRLDAPGLELEGGGSGPDGGVCRLRDRRDGHRRPWWPSLGAEHARGLWPNRRRFGEDERTGPGHGGIIPGGIGGAGGARGWLQRSIRSMMRMTAAIGGLFFVLVLKRRRSL